jgi:hypothetical protein
MSPAISCSLQKELAYEQHAHRETLQKLAEDAKQCEAKAGELCVAHRSLAHCQARFEEERAARYVC